MFMVCVTARSHMNVCGLLLLDEAHVGTMDYVEVHLLCCSQGLHGRLSSLLSPETILMSRTHTCCLWLLWKGTFCYRGIDDSKLIIKNKKHGRLLQQPVLHCCHHRHQ